MARCAMIIVTYLDKTQQSHQEHAHTGILDQPLFCRVICHEKRSSIMQFASACQYGQQTQQNDTNLALDHLDKLSLAKVIFAPGTSG